MPKELIITVGPYKFEARMEEKAPLPCAAFEKILPFRSRTVHVRWSGEAVWVPLGDMKIFEDFENHTSYPSRGDILLYPGGYSETEILIAYGPTSFASKMGPLAGNHFLTVIDGFDKLPLLGNLILWEGAADILFESSE